MNHRSIKGRFVFTFLGCLLILLFLFLSNISQVISIAERVVAFKERQWFKIFEHVLSAISGAILFELFMRSKNTKVQEETIEKTFKYSNKLFESASNIGLTRIYPSRAQAANELLSVMETAKRQILISGIGFSAVVKLSEVADLLQKKVIEKVDVRMLLLNPLSREAVARTLLESSESEAQNIVGTSRERKRDILDNDPFFALRVFCDSTLNVQVINRYEELKYALRFYSHTAPFWMIIIDDSVFWQPYTMGSSGAVDPKSLGPLMPVFRFDGSLNNSVVQNLTDHFEKEWGTSSVDLFHMIGMLEDKKKLLYNIFHENNSDFTNLVGVLRVIRGSFRKDRRTSVRRHCQIPNLEFMIEWQPPIGKQMENKIPSILTSSERQMVLAKIENFNSSCIALCIKDTKLDDKSKRIESLPIKNQMVNVTVAEEPNSNAFKWFKKRLLDPTQGKLKVSQVRKHDSETIIILRHLEPKDRFNHYIQRSLSKVSTLFM